MALQNDGKIIINVLHFSDNTPVANNFSVSRINPDGTLDTTFGINGTAQTTIGNSCNSNYVKVLANQKILVTGYSSGTFKNFAMVKYNPDGSLDTAFGDQGKVITDFNAEAVANCVVLTNDNKLILSGYAKSSASGSNDFAMAKYYLEDALGIASHELSDAVVFYPNPTNNLIHFNQNIKTVSVYSLDGKQIYARLENNKMDCSSFSKGLYMIQATTEDKRVINQKLIKN
jgi:uncharacterized delta-60 repeat protein